MTFNQELTLPASRSCPTCGLQLQPYTQVCPRDGTRLAQPLQVDPAFEKYEFIAGIGAGGMGVIYKARHRALNKFVAIKTLHSHLAGPDVTSRFSIEGKAASLLMHQNIVGVHDFGFTQSGQPYMIMDFVDGKTMSELLQTYGQIPLPIFLQIFIQVCDGMSHAHKRSVMHRDIKPSNLMLTLNERREYDVKIMDFGIAKFMDDTIHGAQNLTKTGEAVGSPIYMSPEQARGRQMDHRSDIYSLGCVMYEALTGSPPFFGNTSLDTMLMHMNQAPLPLSQASLGTKFDPRVETIVMHALEKDPGDRYQSMDELKDDLIAMQQPVPGELPSVASAAQEPRAARLSGKQTAVDESKKPSLVAFIKQEFLIIAVVLIALLGFGTMGYFLWLNEQGKVAEKKTMKTFTKVQSDLTDVIAEGGDARSELETQGATQRVNIGGLTNNKNYERIKDSDLAFIKDDKAARTANFADLNITDVGLDYIANLDGLNQLIVNGTKVKTLRAIVKLPRLKRLYALNTPLEPAAYENMAKVKSLIELQLVGTPITDGDLAKLGSLPNLWQLNISSCKNVTALAMDRFRDQHPSVNIFYGVNDAKSRLDGPRPFFAKAEDCASKGDWMKANEYVTEAMVYTPPGYEPEFQAKTQMLKAKCQMNFKLYRSAAFYIENALNVGGRAGVERAEMQMFLAKAYEAYSNEKDSLLKAVRARVAANNIFNQSAEGRDEKTYKSNLEQLSKDSIALKEYKLAANVLTQLIASSSDKEKNRYEKLLKQLPVQK
ncbi:MAG TPA: serine/threonine-protein kinase [Oculatellaceae cyanobacterium]